jgi:hypothetical protein
VYRGTVVSVRYVPGARRGGSGGVLSTLRDRPEQLAVSRSYANYSGSCEAFPGGQDVAGEPLYAGG